MDVFIGNMEAVLGESKALSELQEDATTMKTIANLVRREGLDRYCHSDVPLLEMAIASARKSLSAYEGVIDRIIICTESHWDARSFDICGIDRLKSELGCDGAHVMGLSFSFCSNFQFALDTAIAFIRSGRESHILLITVDRVEPADTRLVGDNLSVLSDGASSAIVSSNAAALHQGWKVLGNSLLSDSSIKSFAGELEGGVLTGLKGLMQFVRHCFALKKQVLAQAQRRDIDIFVTNNYKRSVSKIFAVLFGQRGMPANMDLIGKWAHVFSSDIVLTLNEIHASVAQGQSVFTFSSGPQSWGATLFEKC